MLILGKFTYFLIRFNIYLESLTVHLFSNIGRVVYTLLTSRLDKKLKFLIEYILWMMAIDEVIEWVTAYL